MGPMNDRPSDGRRCSLSPSVALSNVVTSLH